MHTGYRKKIGGKTTAKGQKLSDKRILCIADLHSGHKTGLTPPRYWDSETFKWGVSQRQAWNWYKTNVKKYGPYDLIICNGDAIAGQNDRQGGTQLITTDRNAQVSMALLCLDETGCDKIRFTYGTPYHVSKGGEDWELTLCKRMIDAGKDAKIEAEGFYNVNGVIINARHKMSSSPQEALRGTHLLKQGLFNDQWYARGIQPHADIIIRSHVHWDMYVQANNRHYISLPALSTLGDKFGARQCDGTVTFGFAVIDISKGGEIAINIISEVLSTQPDKAEVI